MIIILNKNVRVLWKAMFFAACLSMVVSLGKPALGATPDSIHNSTLNIGMTLEPPHLDPTAGAAAAISEVVYNNLFEGLTTIDRHGKVKPLLARSWRVSPDKKTYTFFLKRGALFHNGAPFTARDVVFSFTRASAPHSVNKRRNMFRNMASIVALSKYTVRIMLTHPDGLLPWELGLPSAIIVSQETAQNNKTHPVGTGPYMFKKYIKGYYVELVKFPRYKGKGASIKTVYFRFFPDVTAATASLLSGRIDAYPWFPGKQSIALFASDPKFVVEVGTTEGEVLIAMNNRNRFLKDIRVRRAMEYAIDKKAIISIIEHGRAMAIGSHITPNDEGYQDLSNVYPYNPAKAKRLLQRAGLENLRLQFVVPPSYDLLAQLIANQLRKVGITTVLQSVDWATWLSKVYRNHQYDISVITHVEPMDYEIYAIPNYYFGFNSPKYRKLFKIYSTATNQKKRIVILQAMQKLLAREAVNIWLYAAPKVGIWRKGLEGMWKNMPIASNVLRNVYWRR